MNSIIIMFLFFMVVVFIEKRNSDTLVSSIQTLTKNENLSNTLLQDLKHIVFSNNEIRSITYKDINSNGFSLKHTPPDDYFYTQRLVISKGSSTFITEAGRFPFSLIRRAVILYSGILIIFAVLYYSLPFFDSNSINRIHFDNITGSVESNKKSAYASFKNTLNGELRRAASTDENILLIFVETSMFAGYSYDQLIDFLKSSNLTYPHLYFNLDHKAAMILPSTSFDELMSILISLSDKYSDLYREQNIYFGFTSREARILSENQMIYEADRALSQAKHDPMENIIGFKADLYKYDAALNAS